MIFIQHLNHQNTFIPHNKPTLGLEEITIAKQVIVSGHVAQGKMVEKFEQDFCSFLGLPFGSAVAVSSGTAALFLALKSLDSKGKKVAYPSHTCTALRNATEFAGAESILIDSMSSSPNIDINKIENQGEIDIAIIPHMYGLPQDLTPIISKIKVIEDCAQSLGGFVGNVPVGLQGDIGVFSFYATKLMTSGGQGGMVVSKDSSIIKFIRDYIQFDQREDSKIRFNFQMTDLQASIGIAQLIKLPGFINRRQELFEKYKGANFPLLDSKGTIKPVRFRAIIETSKQTEMIRLLAEKNITAVIPTKEEHLLGSKEQYPLAFQWTKNIVSLPLFPTLTDKEIKYIINAVKSII